MLAIDSPTPIVEVSMRGIDSLLADSTPTSSVWRASIARDTVSLRSASLIGLGSMSKARARMHLTATCWDESPVMTTKFGRTLSASSAMNSSPSPSGRFTSTSMIAGVRSPMRRRAFAIVSAIATS